MEDRRQNPDRLLKEIDEEKLRETKGKLKIFFGYAAGVGKTYAMLQAAHVAKNKNIDVVLGYVEPHARPLTMALCDGLEMLPLLEMTHGTIAVKEFNLDEALKRKPELILIDELAHTNAHGSRHHKRYQDVKELISAGIDVYATINVQHIESLNDQVASITGVFVKERIPDFIFDNADQVELVDIEPSDLIERISHGHVYRAEQAQKAKSNFFAIDNLIALREIALRRCADRINLISEKARIKNNKDYHTDEHILVCLSSSPSNAKIVRTAARMANAFKANFTALFVETPSFSSMSDADNERLRQNIRLAQQLGANIEMVSGEDVPYQIAEFARLSGVSKIVVGRNSITRKGWFKKPTLTEKLVMHAPNVDVHIIPDLNIKPQPFRQPKDYRSWLVIPLFDVLKSAGVLLLSTLIGFAFYQMGFSEANIITVYILGVLIIATITTNPWCYLLVSISSVLIFNFFFTVPRFTFMAYDKGYPVTFLIMFLVSFVCGSLATKLKRHASQAMQAAYRTKILFDTNQILHRATGAKDILDVACKQIVRLLEKDIVSYSVAEEGLLFEKAYTYIDEKIDEIALSDHEKAVATWVYQNNKHAGATTDTLSNSKCLYLAIRVNDHVYGVIGIVINERLIDSFENSILLSILGECALALENEKNAREKEAVALLAKNEKLRANLLRAISHDLRTPLTSISGNASNLLSNNASFDEETKQKIYTDIYDDSMWLINLVENLLSVTRIEEGRMILSLGTHLLEEIVDEALKHINRNNDDHQISVQNDAELVLVKVDARLIVQVLINIVDNAMKYTKQGSSIIIKTELNDNEVKVSVIDNGEGIDDEMKLHIFEMFYTGNQKVSDSRRSLGLGLSLCKSIINAHETELIVEDNQPQGTIFSFTLPKEEVDLHE